MAEPHKFIVVDEYDNVCGYFATFENADCFAEGECAEGKRTTCVYAISEAGQHTYTDEEDE